LLLYAAEQAGGNVTRAAELLSLNANYLHRLDQQFRFARPDQGI